VPDAVIVFRCADILLLNSTDHGFVRWPEYRRLVPADARDIYVLGEPLHAGPWAAPCLNLTRALVDSLSQSFPNATVLVRRGFVFDSLAMIAFSKTVVCPPTLFCLWPALANAHGQVHYAASTLVAAGQQPKLHGGLQWLAPDALVTPALWAVPGLSSLGPGSVERMVELLGAEAGPKARRRGA